MIFADCFDAYDFLKTGHFRSKISETNAGFLLRLIKRFDYLDMPSDHCDAGPRMRADLASCPAATRALNQLCDTVLREDLSSLGEHYRASLQDRVITPLRLGPGYSLDWHNHLGAKCTATALIYLFDEADPGEGGDLVLGEVERDMETVRETDRFKIAHGYAIVIGDASHPLMMHKAEPWTGRGHRYLISLAFNANDW